MEGRRQLFTVTVNTNKITTFVWFQCTDTEQNHIKAKAETAILSPGSRHVDLNHLLNELRTDLKYDSEIFLWISDHITSFVTERKQYIIQIVCSLEQNSPLNFFLGRGIQWHTPLWCDSDCSPSPADNTTHITHGHHTHLKNHTQTAERCGRMSSRNLTSTFL